jgi:hypothetical protein
VTTFLGGLFATHQRQVGEGSSTPHRRGKCQKERGQTALALALDRLSSLLLHVVESHQNYSRTRFHKENEIWRETKKGGCCQPREFGSTGAIKILYRYILLCFLILFFLRCVFPKPFFVPHLDPKKIKEKKKKKNWRGEREDIKRETTVTSAAYDMSIAPPYIT